MTYVHMLAVIVPHFDIILDGNHVVECIGLLIINYVFGQVYSASR